MTIPDYEIFSERFGVDSVRIIHGWNSHEKGVRQFIKYINTELPKVRVLLASPSIGTGIDIQCPIAGVFGYFPGKDIAPTGMLQMLARYRNAETYAAVVPLVKRRSPEKAEDLLERERYKVRLTRKIVGLNSDDVSSVQGEITCLWASYTALHNRYTNNALAMFAALAEREGFPLEWVSGRNEKIQDVLRAARKTRREKDDLLRLTLVAVSPEEFEKKRRSGTLCENDYLALQRWHLENVTKQSITSELLKRYPRKNDLNALIRLTIYAFGGAEDASQLDRLEIEKLPFKRGYMALDLCFISELITLTFGDKGLKSMDELTESEIIQRVSQYLTDNRKTILALDKNRTDMSQDILETFRRMLGRWKIKLAYRQVRHDGEKVYVYSIDQESLAVYMDDAQKRWQGLQEVSQNMVNSDAVIHDLRHKPSSARPSPAAHAYYASAGP